jgi:hypothetical protein
MGSTSGGSRVLVWLRFFPYADVTTDVTRLGWLSVVYSMYILHQYPVSHRMHLDVLFALLLFPPLLCLTV